MRAIPSRWKTGLRRVAPGIFAYVQAGGLNVSNAGLVVGDRDALYARSMTRAFQRAIQRATRRPVRRIVCTHHHADHTLGLVWFERDIPVVAHRRMRERMQKTGLDLAHYRKGLRQRLPDVVYEGGMTLHLGRRAVELHHLGHAHSAGDTLVWLPKERVLFTGDVCFHLVTPAAFDAHVGGWIRIAERILKAFPVETIVPGHGPPGDPGLPPAGAQRGEKALREGNASPPRRARDSLGSVCGLDEARPRQAGGDEAIQRVSGQGRAGNIASRRPGRMRDPIRPGPNAPRLKEIS